MSWQGVAFALLVLVLASGFAWYERAHPPARVVALVAALAALAVAGRLVLAPIPNVVATTDIALITGYALGPAPGFAVGALAAPISNIWLGQGPWTAWQMAGWGLAGLAGAWLAVVTRRRAGRLGLAAACGVAGLAYGALLDLSVMVTYGGEQSLDRYLALSARGVPFNVAHALGNIAFALAAGPALVRMISRYRTRLEFTWRPAGALPLLLLVAAVLAPALARPASEASAAPSAQRWLAAQQNPDGGFAASPDFDSSPAMTGWTMMGLEAAGVNPLDVRKRGRTPVSYLRRQADRLQSANDLERTILALEGAGLNSRRFAGTNLVAQLRARRSADGSVSGQVNLTAFYALALRAAGAERSQLTRSSRWLRRAQNRDGGWGINRAALSDPDSTGAALQALAAAGTGGKSTASAVRWLRRTQRANGGWGFNTTGVVNAQSTSWAVQGLVAADKGGRPLAEGLAYLGRLRDSDGHYRYSAGTDQTPIWVTAQVLLAVEREALPIAPVARAARARSDRQAAGQGAGGPAPGPGAPRGGSQGEAPGGGAGGKGRKGGAEKRDRQAGAGGAAAAAGPGSTGSAAGAPAADGAGPGGPGWTAYAPAGAVPGEAGPELPVAEEEGSVAPYVAVGLGLLALALAGAFLLYRERLE